MERDNLTESVQKRLAAILRAEVDRWRSYSALEQQIIRVVNPGTKSTDKPKLKIDRRKLNGLVTEQERSLTFNELQTLNIYLAHLGISLTSLFYDKSLLEALVENRQVTFLFGSKKSYRRTEISHWDVRAMSHLLRVIERIRPGVHFDLQDVPLRNQTTVADPEPFQTEPWHDLLADMSRPSLVCLGSPRACHAAELMLAKLFQTKPFHPRNPFSEPKRMPFTFLWDKDTFERLPSSFAWWDDSYSGSKDWTTRAIVIEGELYPVERTGQIFHEYGIVAVQRRQTGQSWAVVAGLSGPGTFATSVLLDSLYTPLPERQIGEHSAVQWGVVRALVEWDGSSDGDTRRVLSEEWIIKPRIWLPPK
jgi:hypothetical protein